MNTTSIIAIIVVLVVAAAGLALHPQSPLTIIYLFPDDIYHGWVRLFYRRDDNHGPRFPYPKPQPAPTPAPTPTPAPVFPPNGYNPNLPPRFPADPSIKPIPVAPPAPFPSVEPNGYRPHPNIPAHHGFPVNPNENIPFSPSPHPAPMRPSFPPNIQPIEPQHDMDLHPFGSNPLA
jgi:hypothetical protein